MNKLNFLSVCITVAMTLAGCGGGGGNDEMDNPGNSSNNGSNTTPENDVNSVIYPLSDTVVFRSHSTNDIFKLSDGSAWKITGTSDSGHSTGSTTSKVVIYLATANTPAPVAGIRSDYYLIGDGIKPSFYVEPLLMNKILLGTVAFKSHTNNDTFKLSDGSAWQITGTSNSGYSTGSITSKVVIYSSNANTPNPVEGIRSDYYLIGDGINPAFYIRPINN